MKTPGEIIRVAAASAIVFLGSGAIPTRAAQLRYIPHLASVTISLETNGAGIHVLMRVDFPTLCEFVGTWGKPILAGNRVSVDAEFWSSNWLCFQVMRSVYTQYHAGPFLPGNYDFVFGAWGVPVKTQAFSIPFPEQTRPSLLASRTELCWNTASNAWYQLQCSSTLTGTQWTPLTPWFPGNGGLFCTNDPAGVRQPQRYYRVARTKSPPVL